MRYWLRGAMIGLILGAVVGLFVDEARELFGINPNSVEIFFAVLVFAVVFMVVGLIFSFILLGISKLPIFKSRKVIYWIIGVVVVFILLGVLILYFNSSLYTCGKYYELNPVGNGVFVRTLHRGMSCDPAPRGMANSQVCYGENTLEFKYCQKLGETEGASSGDVLCGSANLFSLLDKHCEDVAYCLNQHCDSDDEDCRTTACEYNARDNVCCVNTFLAQGRIPS